MFIMCVTSYLFNYLQLSFSLPKNIFPFSPLYFSSLLPNYSLQLLLPRPHLSSSYFSVTFNYLINRPGVAGAVLQPLL